MIITTGLAIYSLLAVFMCVIGYVEYTSEKPTSHRATRAVRAKRSIANGFGSLVLCLHLWWYDI